MTTWSNWAGTVRGVPAGVKAPSSEDEVREIVAFARRIAVVGSGHSFAPLVDAEGRTLLGLGRYAGIESVDREAMTVTVRAGTRLDDLNEKLAAQGLSLPNQTAIAEQTVAGATATASHGGSTRYGSLSEHIVAARIVTADGALRVVTAEDEEMDAVRLHLGCLGVVTALKLRIVPAFSVRKVVVRRSVHEALRDLRWLRTRDFGGLYWYPHTDEVRMWWAERTELPPSCQDPAVGRPPSKALLRASMWPVPAARVVNRVLARRHRHSVRNIRSDRAMVGELAPRQQVLEYGVPADSAEDAVAGLTRLVAARRLRIAAPVEVRFTGADTAWLSPAHGRTTCYVNVACYLANNGRTDWETPLREIAGHFAGHGGRSHWAKVHWHDHDELTAQYPRWQDFQRVRQAWDPEGTFLGSYLTRLFAVPARTIASTMD